MRPREIAMTFDEWGRAKLLADRRMKANNGHAFIICLKTRCQNCGRSPRAKGKCGQWFAAYLMQLDTILLNLDREPEVRSPTPREREP